MDFMDAVKRIVYFQVEKTNRQYVIQRYHNYEIQGTLGILR